MKGKPINYEKRIAKLRRPEYSGVFDDLLALTGLSEKTVCRLIMEAGLKSRKEMKFVNPKGDVENELHYRTCREYLFLNAFRPVSSLLWDAHREGLMKGPALDFGAGMGNDTVWLAKQGYDVDYHEIGIIQREFMRFRIKKNGLKIGILSPYVDGKYDSLGCVTRKYGAMNLRDVLEHIPDYVAVVRHLAEHLLPGGLIVEHTPWNFKDKDGKWVHYSVLHHEEKVPLKKLFGDLGIRPLVKKSRPHRHGMWRKDAQE